MSQLKIFVSYCWKDKLQYPVLKTIMNNLENDGWDVWIDVDSLDHGERINYTIGNVLERQDVALVMWSENYKNSDNCIFELNTILRLGLPLVPCRLVNNKELEKGTPLEEYKFMSLCNGTNLVEAAEWGWVQLRQQLLELEAAQYGNDEIIKETSGIQRGVGELEELIYLLKQDKEKVAQSDPFIQQMMNMAIQMAENDTEHGPQYITFCTMLADISRQHPSRADDRLKRQKMLQAIDIADPDGSVPVLQRLRMMTELSLMQG